ncbi:MAG: hypothetical protein LBN95_11035 [Prevotellaceae bacterium]|jgi:hypothetical protein|nr:hypothetical protein [Prevotellaceae bacterium]
MKKIFTLLVIGVVCANFNVFAACPPPTNIQIITVSDPIAGNGIIVLWTPDPGTVPGSVTYDVHLEREGFNNKDSVMGTANNQTPVLQYSRYYNGMYKITVCVHCPDGSVVCVDMEDLYLINHPECKVDVPICPGVDAGGVKPVMGGIKEIELGCGTDRYVVKPSVPVMGGVIDDYVVTSIPYKPQFPFVIPNGFAIDLSEDDRFANIAHLPFKFCFYENVYENVLMGPNGNLTFTLAKAGAPCTWIPPDNGFPNPIPAELKNSVFGVFEDIDPDPSHVNPPVTFHGTFQYAVLGKEGCRVFLMSYNDVPLYSCGRNDSTAINSYQIVLYEGTNIIEVYVKQRAVCAWNGGKGVIGVQNIDGTKATCAPLRNGNDPAWSTIDPYTGVNTPEAWRFTPVSANANYSLNWYNGTSTSGTPFATNIDSLVINCSEASRTLTLKLDIFTCENEPITYRDTLKVYWKNKPVIQENVSLCQGEPFSWRGKPKDTQFAGTFDFEESVGVNCCDSTYRLKLTVHNTYQHYNEKDTICDGENYKFGDRIYTPDYYRPQLYILPSMLPYLFLNDTLSTKFGCDSVVQLKLTVLPAPNVSASPLPAEICGDDVSFTVKYVDIGGGNSVPPTSYFVEFEDKAKAAGFADIATTYFPTGTFDVEIPIPTNVVPDTYECTVTVFDDIFQCIELPFKYTFEVYYPTSILQQKWDDVIAVKNSYYNGGYEFTKFEWYHNDALMLGQNNSYIYLGNETLQQTDTYYVDLTRTDGTVMRTCSFHPGEKKPDVSLYPRIVAGDNSVSVYLTKSPAVARIWTTTGILLQSARIKEPQQEIAMPQQTGTYLFELITDDGYREALPIVVRRY